MLFKSKSLWAGILVAALCGACGSAQVPGADAPDQSVLRDQAFLKTDYITAANPWPDLNVATSNPEASALKAWLITQQLSLRSWPPRFESREDAERIIRDWRRMKPTAEALAPQAQSDEGMLLLLTTFWFFGHNIDEDGSILNAYELVEQGRTNFPDSPLPPTLLGLIELNTSPTAGSEALFLEALEKNPSPGLQYVLYLGLSAICYSAGQNHKSVLHNSTALSVCRNCRDHYQEIHQVVERQFQPSTARTFGMYELYYQEDGKVGSQFFGFELSLPGDWKISQARGFDPASGSSDIYIDAPPLPKNGLVHGLTIVSTVYPQDRPGGSAVIAAMKQKGARFEKIDPLTTHPLLNEWQLAKTDFPVGDDDVIQMIVASATVQTTLWSEPEHQRQAASEGVCKIEDRPGKSGTHVRQNHPPRVNAPVRIDILYNASKGSLETALSTFKQILGTLKIEQRAQSQLVPQAHRI